MESDKYKSKRDLVKRMEKKVLNFTTVIEQDEEGWYIASVPAIQGCHSQGKSMEEVLERIREAIEVCLESDKDFEEPMKFVAVKQVQVNI